MTNSIRALHWVLKIGDRPSNINFFRGVLGMRTLRHEEFEKGCEASCNGPYYGKWSKTMIGYGCEDTHFVLELTYNYEISSYDYCNDFRGVTISSRSVFDRVKNSGYKFENVSKEFLKVLSPDGYPFFITIDEEQSPDKDPVSKISLSVSNTDKSVDFWCTKVGLKLLEKSKGKNASLTCQNGQLELVENVNHGAVDHGTAFGRIAFAVPAAFLSPIEKAINSNGDNAKILTPLISLATPGKATVQVVIAGDPDGYEICFVGDEAFRQLSKVDESADKLLDEAIANDKSVEWFKKKGLSKNKAPSDKDNSVRDQDK